MYEYKLFASMCVSTCAYISCVFFFFYTQHANTTSKQRRVCRNSLGETCVVCKSILLALYTSICSHTFIFNWIKCMYRKLCISRIYICMERLDWVSFTEGGASRSKSSWDCVYIYTNTLERIIHMHINFPITRMTDTYVNIRDGGAHIKLDVLRDGIHNTKTRVTTSLCGTHSPTRFQYSDNSNKVNECVDIIRTSRVHTCFFSSFL